MTQTQTQTESPTPGATYRVVHTTQYTYAEPVSLSMHQVRLTPRTTASQQVQQTRLQIDPPASASSSRKDYYGNLATTFSVAESHHQLRVTAESLITKAGNSGGRLLSPMLSDARDQLQRRATPEALAAVEYQVESPLAPRGAAFARFAETALLPDRSVLEGTEALMELIYREFKYDPVATTVSTPVVSVLDGRRGVCQDFAHLMISCLRSHGVPARYVSGYLVPRPGIVGAQASHAWVAAYCPGVGWVDFDPTNNVMPSHGHITLAWGRDFDDVSPLKGVTVGGGNHTVSVNVRITAEAGA
ncbi:MAG: transglutaminase family protein [Acidobacteria bacterium]|nr:transglutaminase family protein [Acidobacteriota bacterium]